MDIGIDLMGSDSSPLELFHAVHKINLEHGSSITLTVYLDQTAYQLIEAHYAEGAIPSSIRFQIAREVVSMQDDPRLAAKQEGTTQALGMRALAEGKLQAFVSAGNTGALYITARKYLRPKSPKARSFLMAAFPVGKRTVIVCDAGANMSWRADHLVDYAKEAVDFCRKVYQNPQPKVALLNVGTEAMKGTREHRLAYQKLDTLSKEEQGSEFTFIGNIEGRNVLQEEVDIVIADGFSGNILLKTMEGTAAYVFNSILTLLGESQEAENLTKVRTQFHYVGFSGAIFAGFEGLVIKSHGDATEISLYNSISGAIQLLHDRNGLNDKGP